MSNHGEDEVLMTMDFYRDVEVDFGDKFCDFAELLKLREGDSSDSKDNKKSCTTKKKVPTQVVWEEEVDSDEYCYENEDQYDHEYYNQLNEDISLDVLQVTGDALLNEPLEARYRQQNARKTPPAKCKPKSTSKKAPSSSNSKIGTSKILKKSELRKEMLTGESPDNKVGFVQKKKNNAFLNALNKPSTNDDAEAEAAKDEPSNLETRELDPEKEERIMKWVLEHCSSEEESFHSARSSSNPSVSASASDNEITPKKYRATSKRSKTNTTPTSGTNEPGMYKISASSSISSKSPTTSDEVVGFKTSPAPSTLGNGKTPSQKDATKKNTVSMKKSMYTPATHSEYELNSFKDFPAIR